MYLGMGFVHLQDQENERSGKVDPSWVTNHGIVTTDILFVNEY